MSAQYESEQRALAKLDPDSEEYDPLLLRPFGVKNTSLPEPVARLYRFWFPGNFDDLDGDLGCDRRSGVERGRLLSRDRRAVSRRTRSSPFAGQVAAQIDIASRERATQD